MSYSLNSLKGIAWGTTMGVFQDTRSLNYGLHYVRGVLVGRSVVLLTPFAVNPENPIPKPQTHNHQHNRSFRCEASNLRSPRNTEYCIMYPGSVGVPPLMRTTMFLHFFGGKSMFRRASESLTPSLCRQRLRRPENL